MSLKYLREKIKVGKFQKAISLNLIQREKENTGKARTKARKVMPPTSAGQTAAALRPPGRSKCQENFRRMGPLPHGKIQPISNPPPKKTFEAAQLITTGRALRGTFQCRSGASPKWVSEASRQFRLSLGRRLHFCRSIPSRSFCKSFSLSSARLHCSLRAAAPGGLTPPLRVRPRESRPPRKPTSPSPNVM